MCKILVQIFPYLIGKSGLKKGFHHVQEWDIGTACEDTTLFSFKVILFRLKTGMGTTIPLPYSLLVWFSL